MKEIEQCGLFPQTLVFLTPSPFPVSSRFEGLGLGGSFRIWTAAALMMKGLLKTPPSLGREISGGGWHMHLQNG